MKRVKVLTALVMALTLLFGSSISVFAATDVSVDADSKTGTCDSTFTATAENLGGGLVVSIPADLDLTGSSSFKREDYVTVKGNIAATKKVDISTIYYVDWALQGGASTSHPASGLVQFSTKAPAQKTISDVTDTMTTETYTAEQVRASNTTPDQRTLKASVSADTIPVIGEYKATVTFYIEILDAA